MRQQAIKDEAERLVSEFGSDAYDKAREAMREARRRRNIRLERYFAKVAVAIAHRSGKQMGEDTASRYLS
jgi:tellurite resistance protein